MPKLTLYGCAVALFAPLYWPGNLVLHFWVFMIETAVARGADPDHCREVVRPLYRLTRALWCVPRWLWSPLYKLLDRHGFVDAHDAAYGYGHAGGRGGTPQA